MAEKNEERQIESAGVYPTTSGRSDDGYNDIKKKGSDVDVIGKYDDIDEGYDPVFVKKTIRKVDLRLIPILSAMYFVSLCDRSNLGQARAANKEAMQTDLKLKEGNNRYGMITLMFFIPYILLEIPSQLGLRRFGARWWLGFACIAWGLVELGMGFVNNWKELMGLRVMLGAFEACLYPGAAYLISTWYPRKQIATRLAFFYTSSMVFSGLGATLSFGISQMHGMHGKSGWRWIFIMYGIITVAVGVVAVLFLVDFPDRATFLNEEQKDFIHTRINRDRGDAVADNMTLHKFAQYMMDLKLWIFAFMFCTSAMGMYSLAYFLPRILASIGFSNVLSQLLMAPPYLWLIVPSFTSAWISDRVKNMRAIMIVANCLCVITGTLMYSQLPTSQKAARYVGVFLANGGVNTNVSLSIGWAQASIRAQSKRGFTSALIVAWGGVGGIISSVAFYEKDAPGYPTGVWLTVAMHIVVIAFCAGLVLWFKFQNRRADRGTVVLEHAEDFRYQI
ncbi:hypothetical protein Q8F55_002923 [Vanrija albida]|uniref:Major facilitator superfamily (MFS) profile domain-containing protein n=1 Tax=Vanrija albida TaxID=181172 RepID=A0ABR3QB41_9TREE